MAARQPADPVTVLYQCDQCSDMSPAPMLFEVTQITDETGDDGTPVTVVLHLCDAKCLSDYAMGLSLDYPDDGDEGDT